MALSALNTRRFRSCGITQFKFGNQDTCRRRRQVLFEKSHGSDLILRIAQLAGVVR
jgi:hypothetical protein